jgi:hypothetical protein
MKKVLTYTIAALVVMFAVIAVLGIWEVISIEHLLSKSLKTLLVLFISSAVLLYLLQQNEKNS